LQEADDRAGFEVLLFIIQLFAFYRIGLDRRADPLDLIEMEVSEGALNARPVPQ
jgi:hypothetical protein